jgi:hypothetical protein
VKKHVSYLLDSNKNLSSILKEWATRQTPNPSSASKNSVK